MDLLNTLDLSRFAICIISVLFAAYFVRMYQRDKDKRKIMGVISFIFLACSAGFQIIPSSSTFYFIANFISFDFFPITVTALSILYFEIKHQKTLNSLRLFYLGLIVLLATIFVPIDFSQISIVIETLGLIALAISLGLFIRNRQLSYILISLATTSFLGYGLGGAFNMGLPFIFLCYALGFVFIALAFSFLLTDDKSITASVFRVNKQFDEVQTRLQELKIEYKIIFDSANDAIFVINAQSNQIIDCNLEATKLIDRKKEEIIGKNQSVFFVKQENEEFIPSFEEQNMNVSRSIGKQVKTGKDEFKDVAIKLGSFIQGNQKILVEVLRDVTEQNRNAVALADALQSLSEKIDSIQDLNEKLSVVGSLTRHDVRNKLSTVTGYAYILKKKHSDLADVVDGLSKMEQAVSESVKIFDFAKMYEQLGVEDLTYIDVEAKLKEACNLFSGALPKVINDCGGLSVLADSFLRQLFYNFIDNTRKYGKKTTAIRVYFENSGQDRLRLIYEDDGVGIPSENKPNLFKEGFSTGGSTGFGLFLVKKMMDVYGWTITEEGEPGEGVKFIITIPKLDKNGKENYQVSQYEIGTISLPKPTCGS
jgi:PAS domain S-box-containing protein